MLDVGCSSGSLLRVASGMGLQVAGAEPALAAAQAAKDAGFDVFAGYLQDARYPDASFDVITLFEIVEHLSDPTALVKECCRILRPGGVLAVNTPNAHSWTARYMKGRWEGFSLVDLGGHASFFSPTSIRTLADLCGLRVCRIETRNVRFYESGQCERITYRIAKILAQLLALPARIFGQGHDLLVFMRKEKGH
jgi:SAM-dependent methyltransferase